MPEATDLDAPLALYQILLGLIVGVFSCFFAQLLIQSQERGIVRILSVVLATLPGIVAFPIIGREGVILNYLIMMVFCTFKILTAPCCRI